VVVCACAPYATTELKRKHICNNRVKKKKKKKKKEKKKLKKKKKKKQKVFLRENRKYKRFKRKVIT